MFLGLAWYWWLVAGVILALSFPFKIKFLKWWGNRQREKKANSKDKWGDER